MDYSGHKSKRSENNIIIKKLYRLPWMFLAVLFVILSIGIALLYSASGGKFDPWASKQIKHLIISIPIMITVAIIDIRFWFRNSYLIYLGGLALLVLVYLIGVEGGLGAKRWLRFAGFTFQPSEIMKVCLVVVLARYFHMTHVYSIKRLSILVVPFIFIGAAVILILKQPNLGTATIVACTSAAIIFMAGVSWKKFAFAGVLFLIALPVAWSNMHDYQKKRVDTFLNPEKDPLGAGYNIIQSKIAIGSGGVWGKGYLKGTQGRLSFVPEKQTDFIFSIVAEEFGFVGSIFVLILYTILILMGIRISMLSESNFGSLVAFGIITILFIHVFVNMGMVMGILPVVGVPLPLLSYGGSSLLSTMAGFGFILNVYVHRDVKLESME